MPDILLELPIAAPPERVYAAITEAAGLSSWWTPEVDAEPRVGSTAEFRFGGGRFVVKMEISELEPGRGVRWAVKQGAPEWAGTSVGWELAPAGGGTRVRFRHHGYSSVAGSFASVNFNWAFYLSSLKDYLETGRGRPGELHAEQRSPDVQGASRMPTPAVVQFEITGRDPTALHEFYAGLFGWDLHTTPGGSTSSYRRTSAAETGLSGAVGPTRSGPNAAREEGWDGGSGQVTVYVEVADLPASLAAAQRLGGSVVAPMHEVPGRGLRLAFIADPEGHVIGLAQGLQLALEHTGYAASNQP